MEDILAMKFVLLSDVVFEIMKGDNSGCFLIAVKRKMREIFEKNKKICYLICIIIIAVLSVPQIFEMKSAGLDPSWVYAINSFRNKGFVFGKDFVSTYGPLGFIIRCQNVGYNMVIATLIWIGAIFVHIVLLYQLLLKKAENNKYRLSVLIGIVIYIFSYNPRVREYYFVYLAVFSFFLVLNGFKKNVYIFDILLCLCFLTKFSLFIILFTLILFYMLFGFFYNKKLYKYSILRMFIGIALLPIGYFVFSGISLRNFYKYVKGSLEVSAGYSSAMSVREYEVLAIWVIIAAAAYIYCVFVGIKSGMYNFMIYGTVGICLFMCFKHGFVRADDGHTLAAVNAMLIFMTLVLFFLDWEQILAVIQKYKKLYFTMFSIVFMIAIAYNGNGSDLLKSVKERIIDLPYTISKLCLQDKESVDKLPDNFVSEIGDASVSIYPWEISYCISNELNYIPMYGVQAYSTYTPYLDKETAEKLEKDLPEYIVFSLDTIDNRWPLVECPQIWEVIRANYYIDMQEDNLFLLKRQVNEIKNEYIEVKEDSISINDEIAIEDFDYLKLDFKLNFWGKFVKMIWKIPEIDMHVYYDDGTQVKKRVLVEMLSNGVEVGKIVRDNETFIDIINDSGDLAHVKKISFEGKGLSYYKDNVKVLYYLSEQNNKESYNGDIKSGYAELMNITNFSDYTIIKNSVNFSVDSDIKTDLFEKINGWAYIGEKTDDASYGDICIQYDDKIYKCNKIARTDVKNTYMLSTDMVGFSALIKGKQKEDEGKVCIIDVKNQRIYE